MDIRAAEISAIIKQQIAGFGAEAEVAEVGQVLSVGDGMRVHGLDNVKAGEMVSSRAASGMALNLETDNVGVVIFGDDRGIRKATRSSARHRRRAGGQGLPAAWSTAWATRSTARARSRPPNASSSRSRRPASSRKSVTEPMQTGLKRSTRWCRSAAASAS